MPGDLGVINSLFEKVLSGYSITKHDALELTKIPNNFSIYLYANANLIKNYFKGSKFTLCAIINAKSGICSEDCAFCAQSSISKAKINKYPLLDKDLIIQKAHEIKSHGVKRFSIVTSGRKVSEKELLKIAEMINEIKKIGLIPCASLGILDKKELKTLKLAGLDRYHHNLETSERFFPKICKSHSYIDKIKTIENALSVGLSVCSGGIFGLGEDWEDRVDMAFKLRELKVDSIPINFFIPIKGTKLEKKKKLKPIDALKIISLYRFILPDFEIRICGGRVQVLKELHPLVLFSGVDGLMTGNYLTTTGRDPVDDVNMIISSGYQI